MNSYYITTVLRRKAGKFLLNDSICTIYEAFKRTSLEKDKIVVYISDIKCPSDSVCCSRKQKKKKEKDMHIIIQSAI